MYTCFNHRGPPVRTSKCVEYFDFAWPDALAGPQPTVGHNCNSVGHHHIYSASVWMRVPSSWNGLHLGVFCNTLFKLLIVIPTQLARPTTGSWLTDNITGICRSSRAPPCLRNSVQPICPQAIRLDQFTEITRKLYAQNGYCQSLGQPFFSCYGRHSNTKTRVDMG
jgi:hypothetical protein